MSAEKRKERRVKVDLPIKITYGQGFEAVGTVENLSRLGAYAKINKQISAASVVEIALEIPDYAEDNSLSGALRCKGEVFRSHPLEEAESGSGYGVGVFFTDFFSDSDKEKLSAYIEFVIENEEQAIQDALRRRKGRHQDHHTQTISLLKEILHKLDDISRRLRTRK